MHALNERQLEIMRVNYPGFKEKDEAMRRVKDDEARYKKQLGYTPFLEGDKHEQNTTG